MPVRARAPKTWAENSAARSLRRPASLPREGAPPVRVRQALRPFAPRTERATRNQAWIGPADPLRTVPCFYDRRFPGDRARARPRGPLLPATAVLSRVLGSRARPTGALRSLGAPCPAIQTDPRL